MSNYNQPGELARILMYGSVDSFRGKTKTAHFGNPKLDELTGLGRMIVEESDLKTPKPNEYSAMLVDLRRELGKWKYQQ